MKLMSHGNQAEAMSLLQDGVQESLGPRGPVAVPQASSLQGKHNPQAESKAPQAPQACAQPIDATALLGGEFLCADGASSINQKGALGFPVFLPCTEELLLAVRLLHREALIADDGQPIVFSQRCLQFPASPHSMLPSVPMLTLACVSTGSAHRVDVDDLEVAQDEGNKEAIVQMILDLASACSIGGARGGGWQANSLIPERIDSCNSGDSPVICSQYNWQLGSML